MGSVASVRGAAVVDAVVVAVVVAETMRVELAQ
jgi:hypothetical protein